MDFKRNKYMIVKIIMLCLMFMLMGLSQVYAENEENEKSPHQGQECLTYKHRFMRTHIDMYYELLAEKYVPDQVKVWENIRKERDMLKKKLTDAKKNGQILHPESITRNWYKDHKDLQEDFSKMIKQRDDEGIKKLLPKIFKHHQELNDLYKKALKNVE